MKNCHTLLQKVEIDSSLSFFFFVFKKYNIKKSMESVAILTSYCSKSLIIKENLLPHFAKNGQKSVAKVWQLPHFS
jgi:hypothetical protein